MRPVATLLGRLDEALAASGLMTRGAVREGAQAIILVGHAGSSIWAHFCRWRAETEEGAGPDPLDRWSRAVIEPVARAFDATPLFPFDVPYRPFQRWAMEAEGLRPSPLGILVHPEYGLWHAYRGALAFDDPCDLPSPAARAHPCDACREKPCLTSCPVGAFSPAGFDPESCGAHLHRPEGASCLGEGCGARLACPVGRDHAYTSEQQRFHMAAFRRSRAAPPPPKPRRSGFEP